MDMRGAILGGVGAPLPSQSSSVTCVQLSVWSVGRQQTGTSAPHIRPRCVAQSGLSLAAAAGPAAARRAQFPLQTQFGKGGLVYPTVRGPRIRGR